MNCSPEIQLLRVGDSSLENSFKGTGFIHGVRSHIRPEEFLLLATFATVFTWLSVIQITGLGDTSLYLSPMKIAGLLKYYLLENSLFLPIAFGLIVAKKGLSVLSAPPGTVVEKDATSWKSRICAALSIMRDFLPFVLVIAVYWIATEATKAFVIWEADPALLKLEEMTVGRHVFITFRMWLDSSFFQTVFGWFNSSVNAFLVMSYSSYYLTPAILAALIYTSNRRPLFRRFMLSLILVSMMGYILYNLVPVRGPKYFFPEIYLLEFIPVHQLPENMSVLGKISELTRLTCDCFPSLHTAWTLLNLITLYQFSKWLFALYLPIGIGVITATIYLGEHYVPDLFAGAVVAAIAWILAKKVERNWPPKPLANTGDQTSRLSPGPAA